MPDYKAIVEDVRGKGAELVQGVKANVLVDQSTRTGLPVGILGVLCYLLGWVSGVVVLGVEFNNTYLRFHALQSICVFLALSIVGALVTTLRVFLLGFAGLINWMLGVFGLVVWMFLMWKGYRGGETGETYKVPVLGELIEARM